jgi:hypothetical protein
MSEYNIQKINKMQNFKHVANVNFPDFKGININMMPFIMGDNDSIPTDYHAYIPILEACQIPKEELGKVGYISIMESVISPGKSQRRAGLHTEKHPSASWGGGGNWGGTKGGLYLASNVDDGCAVYDANIQEPGTGGYCGHLRKTLGQPTLMKKNQLFWMHDGVPHESLKFSKETTRQWFRLVTSEVSLWYAVHSTVNPLGIVPSAETKIIHTSKFEQN